MNNDLISREALIKWIDDSVSQYYGTYSTDMLNMWGLFKDYLINNAPTVEERPKGAWKYDGFCVTTTSYKCPFCKSKTLERTKFCSECGADMREADNDKTN